MSVSTQSRGDGNSVFAVTPDVFIPRFTSSSPKKYLAFGLVHNHLVGGQKGSPLLMDGIMAINASFHLSEVKLVLKNS